MEEVLDLPLSSGYRIPTIGLGTGRISADAAEASVSCALQNGYLHLDCASNYKNESGVGIAIRKAIEDGIVARESLFVTSKLWNHQHAAGDVPIALEQTLHDLGLEYLDLYLIHWPITDTRPPALMPTLRETWGAMEELVDRGLVRSIGVSNFSARKLQELCAFARIRPAVNQVELHPLFRQDRLLEVAAELGVHLTAYSPLGSHSLSNALLEHPTVCSVASALGRTPAQVVLRWALQRGCSAIPKSVTPSRIASNRCVDSWALSAEQMALLSTLGPQTRCMDGARFLNPHGPYASPTQLWDEEEEIGNHPTALEHPLAASESDDDGSQQRKVKIEHEIARKDPRPSVPTVLPPHPSIRLSVTRLFVRRGDDLVWAQTTHTS